MLSSKIHDELMAYTDRELEILRSSYQFNHKFSQIRNHLYHP